MASASSGEGDDKPSCDDAEGITCSHNQHIDQQMLESGCRTHPISSRPAVESPASVDGDVIIPCSPSTESGEAFSTNMTTSPPTDDECASGHPASNDSVPCSPAACRTGSPSRADNGRPQLELPEPSSTAAAERNVSDAAHHIKWVHFHGARSPIITQNANGPCPLLALINVMLLKGKVQLPLALETITIGQLMDYIGDTMLDSAPSQAEQPDFQQNMQDAVAILPKLQTGLDVNVKFCGVQEFEYTPECCIFDLLHVRLYHGWLPEPAEPDVRRTVAQCGYNQLVDKIITNKSSDDPELSHQALLAENFLEKTASQLTAHGLNQLRQTMREGELAVFFRNNHFSTIYKYQDVLYLLVTDQGFLREPRVVWETLTSTDGAGRFVDGSFESLGPAERPPSPSPLQLDHDYLVALSLEEESSRQQAHDARWEEYKQAEFGAGADLLSDAELARRLQEEEDRGHESQQPQPPAQQQQQQQQQPQPQQQSSAQRRMQRIDSTSHGSEGRRKNCALM